MPRATKTSCGSNVCNPSSSQEARAAGESVVQEQPGLHSKILEKEREGEGGGERGRGRGRGERGRGRGKGRGRGREILMSMGGK
jgi:hypothetical protein